MEKETEKQSEIMNLIGYGLAKFDIGFAREFGCNTKSAFYGYVVKLGLAKSVKAVSNRQDSFDPYFDNGRRGWYQRNQRKHIKLFIDSLFGSEDVRGFADITKQLIEVACPGVHLTENRLSPAVKSKFKQMQETGMEAELYFINNYRQIPLFASAALEDARLWGDGYDFQLANQDEYFLAEIKGVRGKSGSIRLTQNEYDRAREYKDGYCLVVVSNLDAVPKLVCVRNPV